MDTALALGDVAEKLGVVAAAAATAGVFALQAPRRRALAMACALALVPVLLIAHIWNTEQFRHVRDDPATYLPIAIAGMALVAVLAAAFSRRIQLLAMLAVAALPFRVPVEAAGKTANLLVPLYLVIAGAALAYVWGQFRGRAALQPERPPSRLELVLGGFIGLYALQSLYSRDFDSALEQMVFFLVPFALLLRLLAQVRWTRSLVLRCLGVAVALAVVFASVGFWEYGHRELLWNPKVIRANEFEPYFRVNSVFWDPNIYGRFLVMVMVASTALMLWSVRQRVALATAAVLAILWGGLVLTLSQSSFAALLVGLAVLGAVRWDPRRTAVVSAVGLGLGMLFVLTFQGPLRVNVGSSSSLNRATSGRVDLIRGGVELFAHRPLWGYGSGSFARAFRQQGSGDREQAVSASHTLPITVAAEQGLVGLGAYLLILLASFGTLFGRGLLRPGRLGRAPPVLEGFPDDAPPDGQASVYVPARAALAAAFAALVTHTMMYAAFLEDPSTWVILAVGLALAAQGEQVSVPEAVSRHAGEPASAVA